MAKHASVASPAVPGEQAAFEVVLLHGFAVRQRDVVIEMPMAAQRLLAFLALHGRPLQRSFVAGNLWIDASEPRALASLRTTVWRIRRRAVDLISSNTSSLSLAPSVAVDLHLAAECARNVLRQRRAPTSKDLTLLCDADDLLPDWYDDWLLIERERFRQLRIGALESLCETLTAEGRYRQATEAAISAVAAEPLRESAHHFLIRSHVAAGNLGEALRAYRLLHTLLDDQLGVEPSRETRALLQRFLP